MERVFWELCIESGGSADVGIKTPRSGRRAGEVVRAQARGLGDLRGGWLGTLDAGEGLARVADQGQPQDAGPHPLCHPERNELASGVKDLPDQPV